MTSKIKKEKEGVKREKKYDSRVWIDLEMVQKM